MFEEENLQGFEALMDDDGLLPGDDAFAGETGDDANAEAFEEHVEEFDEDGNPVEPEAADDEDEADPDEEAKDESEGDDDADGEPKPDDAEPQLFDITIDGEEYEVNLPELTAGYLRNEEFVKRTSALEAEYADKLATADLKNQELVRELDAMAVLGMGDLSEFDKVDWNRLKAEDPEEYNRTRISFIEKRDSIHQTMQRKQSVQALLQKAEAIKHEAYLTSQRELVGKLIPEFNDEGFQPRLMKYAVDVGFTPDEVNAISDARQLLVLENARKFAEGQLKRKATLQRKPVADLPEVLKPGAKAPVVDRDAKRRKAAVSRLHNEGTLDAAAAAFLDFV